MLEEGQHQIYQLSLIPRRKPKKEDKIIGHPNNTILNGSTFKEPNNILRFSYGKNIYASLLPKFHLLFQDIVNMGSHNLPTSFSKCEMKFFHAKGINCIIEMQNFLNTTSKPLNLSPLQIMAEPPATPEEDKKRKLLKDGGRSSG
ncbi:hypothetical protein ACJX0J_022158, partial [Zea mays]